MKLKKLSLNKRVVFSIFLICLIFTLKVNWSASAPSFFAISKSDNETSPFSEGWIHQSLTPHDPITIRSDSDFNLYSFPGIGTEGDPYLIENYNITSEHDVGISISHTTKFFEIKNCFIDDQALIDINYIAPNTATIIDNHCRNALRFGMKFTYSPSLTIINNSVEMSRWRFPWGGTGIALDNCANSTLIENKCSQNGEGIWVFSSQNCSFLRNTCYNNYKGIIVSGAYSTLEENYCYNNVIGLHVLNAEASNITNNICINNGQGIILEHSQASVVTYNTFTGDGLDIIEDEIEDYSNYTLSNNLINGKEFGLLFNLNQTTISGTSYAQLFLINCTNITLQDLDMDQTSVAVKLVYCSNFDIFNSFFSENYACLEIVKSEYITLNNIICYNSTLGIKLDECNSIVVTDSVFNLNGVGISIVNSETITVLNNLCSNNSGCIYLDSSSNSIVSENTCNSSEYGISGSLDHSTISNNICNDIEYEGIYASGSYLTVTNNELNNCCFELDVNYLNSIIENNIVNGKKLGFFNNIIGLELVEPEYGQLILSECHEVTIANQQIFGLKYGLYLSSSDHAKIINNTFSDNWETGMYLTSCRFAEIESNIAENNHYGIFLRESRSALIDRNICRNNTWFGMYISDTSFCSITYNLIQENLFVGICIYYSDFNEIHHNTFLNNNIDGELESQASDWGNNNTWYDVELKEGNYWSDYNGTGPYPVLGGSLDLYPLKKPTWPIDDKPSFYYAFISLAIIPIGALFYFLIRRRKII